MKSKKLQFEKLKNKLKNIFFRKLIQVVNNSPKLNLLKEHYDSDNNEIIDKDNKKELKEKSIFVIKNIDNKDFILSNNQKINNSKNIIISKEKENNISKISLDPKKLTSSNKIKELSKPFLFKNNIIKNNLVYDKKNNNNYITKNLNTNKLDVNKTFNVFKNYNIKLLQKPNDVKNLKIENIFNQNFELDNKDFTIPSKEQLKILKDKLKLNKADINKNNKTPFNISKIKKPIVKEKISKISKNIFTNKVLNYNRSNNLTSNIFNFSSINPINIDKNKTLYALPAYQEGTDGPVSMESIGKIHAGEMILNKKQSASFSKNLMKTELSSDLKIKRPPTDSEPEQETTAKLEANSTNENSVSSAIPMDDNAKALAKDKILNNIPNEISKPDLLIKEKVESPLFINSVIKKQSLPSWRTTVG